jgi:putative ABC transport system permease protein
MLEAWIRDVRQAWRALLRAALLTAVVVLTLGLGIGGTVTMFTAVNAAFLHPLPYPDADRLVTLWQTRGESRQIQASMLDFLDWRAQSHQLSQAAAFRTGTINVTSGPEPSRSPSADVVPEFFSTLGVPPRLGRTFSPQEAVPNGPNVVILGYDLWRRVFHSDPAVLERTINLAGADFQVVGVMPEGFSFPDDAALWFPLPTRDNSARSAHNYRVVARIQPGSDLQAAQADLSAVAARLARSYPDSDAGYGISAVPLRRDLLGKTGPVLLLLLGAVSLVFLIACSNVVHLLFARSLARQGDATVRLALGADRKALLRPFLAESFLLSLLGGLCGFGLTLAGRKALTVFSPRQMFDPAQLRIDGTVVLFTLGLTLLTGFACGLAPALRTLRWNLRAALSENGRTLSGAGRGVNVLVTMEVALAFLLLVGAGLLIRSAARLEAVDPGFRPAHVALVRLSLGGAPGSHYEDSAWRVHFLDQLIERAGSLPGAGAAGAINQAPLVGASYNGTLEVESLAGAPEPRTLSAHYRLIGGRYFEALGIPLERGQRFAAGARAGAPLVAIVNHRLARDLAGAGDVLGRRLRIPGMDGIHEWATVVGVVGDVRHRGLDREPVPEVYFPYAQRPDRAWGMVLFVRTRAAPQSLTPALRREIRALDPTLPSEIRTMDEVLRDALAPTRFRMLLLTVFALVALTMACVGIFGVVSFAVSRRNREVGIRMALGAGRGAVRTLICREAMTPVVLGIGIGAAAASGLTRTLASMVFEIGVDDPGTFTAVALILLATALAATLLPAERATRVDPVEALGAE